MTKKEFISLEEEKGFVAALDDFAQVTNDIVHEDVLVDYIKWQIDKGNFGLASFLLDEIYHSDNTSGYYRYDLSMGTLETPTSVDSIEDIEDLFWEEDETDD